MNESYYEHLFGVRDKNVRITGGTRGIGRMIAEGMVRCGANVYVASRNEEVIAREVLPALQQLDPKPI